MPTREEAEPALLLNEAMEKLDPDDCDAPTAMQSAMFLA
jgi:hypothetical protein